MWCTSGINFGTSSLPFLIYINDLTNISKVLHFFYFADGTNIYYETPETREHVMMNKELRELQKWLVNRLSLNIDNTNFSVFHPYNKPLKHIITLKFHKKAILEKNLIDSTLSWHTRIEKHVKKM